MKFEYLIFVVSKVLIIILLVGKTSGIEHHYEYKCAKYGTQCDPLHQQACCETRDECKYVVNLFLCVGKGILGRFCKNDEDCAYVRHAKCSEDKQCICRPNTIRFNETMCVPLLGEFCWKNERCAANNSVCVNNECQCKSGFEHINDQCLPKILGSYCECDANCNKIKFSKCSENKICICASNTIEINGVLCSPLLDVHCYTNEECRVDNSVCIDNKCQCKSNYKSYSDDNKCQLPFIGMPCPKDSSCDYLMDHSICSEKKQCQCAPDYNQMGDSICTLFNTRCINDKMCSKNFICVNKECQCKPNYVNRGSKCLPTYLNAACNNHTDCYEISFAICSERNICICGNNYKAINEKICAAALGGFCFFGQKCADDNAICIDHQCQCKPTASLSTNNQCVPIRLGKPCERHEDCEPITNLRCSANNICVCNFYHAAVNESYCTPIIGGFCLMNKDCHFSNFHCINNKCQCKPNFIAISSRQCIENNLATTCFDVLDCSDPWHAGCSTSNKCICKTNHLAINNATCYPILDGYCWDNSQCIIRNSVCSDFQCACKSGFVAISDNLCIPNTLHQSL